MTWYVHMLQGCCTVGMCMSMCMAGDYACAYTFLFTVDCSGHITCTCSDKWWLWQKYSFYRMLFL